MNPHIRPLAFLLAALVAGCAAQSPAPTPVPASIAPTPPPTAAQAARSAHYAEPAAVQSLADAIDDRLAAMPGVAAAKWVAGAPILDTPREQAVLQQVGKRAREMGLDVAATQKFFAAQIAYARDVQQGLHDEWKAAGECAPCRSPVPLQDVREQIDAANARELAALQVLAPLGATSRSALQAQLRATLAAHRLDEAEAAEQLSALAAAVTRTDAGPALERIRASGMLRIGTTGDYAPFSLEAGGELAGADIELARELAANLGVTPVYVRTSWPTLVEDLVARRFDVALSGISWTAERGAVGSFSVPYQEGGKTLLARCVDRERFDQPADLDRPGVRVIVNPGGTNERYVREHVRAATIVVYPDNRGVFEEIAAGRADVMVTDDVEAELQARRRAGVLCRTYPGTLTRGEKRILMTSDAGLQAAVDGWLAGAIARGEPGRLLEQAMTDYVRHPPGP